MSTQSNAQDLSNCSTDENIMKQEIGKIIVDEE
jgi:hypothetical protein